MFREGKRERERPKAAKKVSSSYPRSPREQAGLSLALQDPLALLGGTQTRV